MESFSVFYARWLLSRFAFYPAITIINILSFREKVKIPD